MWDWLKKQVTRDKTPGVQTMADLFSGDIVPQKAKDYFEPVPTKGADWNLKDDFRVRDFARELPGAVGDVAKEIAQGTARSLDWIGRKITPWDDKVGATPTIENFLYGGGEKRKNTLGGVAEVETGISEAKHPILAPMIGGVLVGLDAIPGGKGAKTVFASIAKSADPDEIFKLLRYLNPKAEDDALKNIAGTLVDVKDTKAVKETLDTLLPGVKDVKVPTPTKAKGVADDGSVEVPTKKFKVADDEEFYTATQDVLAGRKSPSKLPILAIKNKDGTFSVKDGKHRLAEAILNKDAGIRVITDEAVYRKLADAEEARRARFVQDPATGRMAGSSRGVATRDRALMNFQNEEDWDSFAREGGTLEDLWRINENAPDKTESTAVIADRILSMAKEMGYKGEDNRGLALTIDGILRHSDPGFYEVVKKRTAQSGTALPNKQTPEWGYIEEQLDYMFPPELVRALGKKKTPVPPKPPVPVFEGLQGTTLKTIEKLKGRSVASNGFIQNLLRSQDVTKQEREAITEVLLTKGDKVNVKELAEEVQAQLLPLERTDVQGGYSGVYLPREKQMEPRMDAQNYHEIVYQSPVMTSAGRVHFHKYTDNTPAKYFAHTRAWDLADKKTRQVIEVQSDLFQKGRLESERLGNELDTGVAMSDRERTARVDRNKKLDTLIPYSQTWWKRIVREEVQSAKNADMEYVQFPTGKTAMEVEGLGGNRDVWRLNTRWSETDNVPLAWKELSQDDLKVGANIQRASLVGDGGNWIVTEVIGDGKFKAVPKHLVDTYNPGLNPNKDLYMERASETFDISGEVDTSNPIFKFYESDMATYLRGRYNAYKFTDAKGVEWMQVDLAGMPKGAPVEAFAVAPIAGLETDEEGNITGFDPLKAALGFAVVGAVGRAQGSSAYKQAVENGKKTIVNLSGRRKGIVERYGMNEQSVATILDAQRRHVIPHPETVRLAQEIPLNFQKLIDMAPGTIVRGEQAEMYKQGVAGYKSYVRKARENHLSKPQDALLKKQYDDSVATLTRAYANLEAIYSEAGRVVESSKITPVTRSPIINANIQKVRSQLPPEAQVKFDMDLENLDLDNPTEVMDFLTNAQKTTWVQKVVEYYRASLLSAVTTNVVNATGNLLSTIADIPVRGVAGLISKGRTALTGAPRDVYVGEAWKLLSTGVKSTNEATVHAFRALMDEHYALQFNRSLVESGTQIPAIKGTKGKIIRLPYRLLSAMDLFFRTIKTNSEAEALLYRRARQEGLEGLELVNRIEELRRKMPTDIVEGVTERADRALYLEELTGFLKDAENMKNRHPWMQMLIPFYRTLVNLMREAFRMTPARFMSKDKWITGADTRTEEISRATLGTLAGLYLTSAVMDGRLEVTGAAPTDSKERDVFYGTGKIPYAIRVGNEWVPYQRVQPFSTILFLASKTADVWNFHKETGDMNPSDAADAANLLGSEIAQFFVNQAPMQGIATFLEFLEGGKYNQGALPAAGDFFAQMLGGFVPNIIYSGVRAADPTIYITEGIGENIQKRIPGMQDGLTPRRGALGDVSERPGTPMQRFLNPFTPSPIKNDPVYAELERLGTGVGFPTKKAFQQSIGTKEYDVLMQDVGPNTREEIWKLMQSSNYQKARDDQKVEMIDDVVTRTRKESVGALFPHMRDKNMTMQQLLNMGATDREAYEIAENVKGLTPEQSATLADMLLQERKKKGVTPPTLSELLAQ